MTPKKKPEQTIFDTAFSKGRGLGYLEALSDMLKKEEKVLMMVEDLNLKHNFQTETFVIESKHVRNMLTALRRDRSNDQ